MTELIVAIIVLWAAWAAGVVIWVRRRRWPESLTDVAPPGVTGSAWSARPSRRDHGPSPAGSPRIEAASHPSGLQPAPHRGRLVAWGGSIKFFGGGR